MDGNEFYKNKYDDKINNIIEKNAEMPFINGFIDFIYTENSQTSVYTYTNNVIRFMKTVNKQPEDLTLNDYSGYLRGLSKKVSSYQITVYTSLKKFSIYLKAININKDDPMQYIKRPKYVETHKTKEKRMKGYLTKEEIEIYVDDVKNIKAEGRALEQRKDWKERDLAIIMILLTTGMRCNALHKLNIDNIDLNEKVIKTVDKGGDATFHYLSKELCDIINNWMFKREKILNGVLEDAFLISNRKTRMTEISIARIVKKYSSRISNKNITPHKLRATYGTQIYEETGNIYMVQKCMGHKSPETSELYVRGQENKSRKKGSDIMSDILFKKGGV